MKTILTCFGRGSITVSMTNLSFTGLDLTKEINLSLIQLSRVSESILVKQDVSHESHDSMLANVFMIN